MRKNRSKTVTPFVDPSVGKTVEKSKTSKKTARFTTKEIEYKTKDSPRTVFKEKENYVRDKSSFKATVTKGGVNKKVLVKKKDK